jgi:hypothetical protein
LTNLRVEIAPDLLQVIVKPLRELVTRIDLIELLRVQKRRPRRMLKEVDVIQDCDVGVLKYYLLHRTIHWVRLIAK